MHCFYRFIRENRRTFTLPPPYGQGAESVRSRLLFYIRPLFPPSSERFRPSRSGSTALFLHSSTALDSTVPMQSRPSTSVAPGVILQPSASQPLPRAQTNKCLRVGLACRVQPLTPRAERCGALLPVSGGFLSPSMASRRSMAPPRCHRLFSVLLPDQSAPRRAFALLALLALGVGVGVGVVGDGGRRGLHREVRTAARKHRPIASPDDE